MEFSLTALSVFYRLYIVCLSVCLSVFATKIFWWINVDIYKHRWKMNNKLSLQLVSISTLKKVCIHLRVTGQHLLYRITQCYRYKWMWGKKSRNVQEVSIYSNYEPCDLGPDFNIQQTCEVWWHIQCCISKLQIVNLKPKVIIPGSPRK